MPDARPEERSRSRLVRTWLVEDDRETGDLVVTHSEVARQDELVGQVGLVVGAVVAGTNDDVAVVVEDLAHLHRDVVSDELSGHEGPDGNGAPDLTPVVVDVGVGGEGGDDPVQVEGVDCGYVLGDDAAHFGGDGHDWLLPCSDRPSWPMSPPSAMR